MSKRILKRVLVSLILLVAFYAGVHNSQAQFKELTWWSIPYGDQETCGGPEFTQIHFYEWRGDRPEFIYILVTGPHTYDFEYGVWIPHYRITNVFPAVWEWEVQNCDADYRQCWIFGRLKDSMWVDADSHTVPIGYEIQLHFLEPGFNDGADHWMAAWYGPGTGGLHTVNAGLGMYDARGCVARLDTYLPTILK